MTNVGIIAGRGKLPQIIGKILIKKNYRVNFFCIKGFADLILYKNFNNIEIDIHSFSEIINKLKKNNVDQIILAGGISRPSIKDVKFDLKTISLIKDYFLESKGDDKLLKSILNIFKKSGFPLFDWTSECKELFAFEKNLTKKEPSIKAIKNKNKGLNIFKLVGEADIGQSLIIQNELVLGIECIEGTDELIKRTSEYKKEGDQGVLIKLSKYNQHNKVDLPTIGLKTVKLLFENEYEGVFVEKNKCLILEKEKVIDFCNKNKLFISTLDKIE